MKTKRVLYLYLAIYSITFVLWFLAKQDFIKGFSMTPYLYLAQIIGLSATITIGMNSFLAARFYFVSRYLGCLDRVYKQHGLTGKAAFTLMLLHPLFIALSIYPDMASLKFTFISFRYLPYVYAETAVFLFSFILILTIFVIIPWHIWKVIHQMIVFPMILAALHVTTVSSDISYSAPLALWTFAWVFGGIAMYIYKVFLYKFLGPKRLYKVSKVADLGEVTEIIMDKLSASLNFEPGQFAFLVFENSNPGREEHPFSISSSPLRSYIRFSVKKSGDFTGKLSGISEGTKVRVYGPYGEFGKTLLVSKKKAVLIAGGIGITPFLSILEYLYDAKKGKDLTLFYVFRDTNEGIYLDDLKKYVKQIKGAKLITHISSVKGRFNTDTIAGSKEFDKNALYMICGPYPMIVSLKNQLKSKGVPPRNIISEDFNLK